ncbi:hypothetical protein FA09DRAFT_339441 [Tilletiopsis washingtonensis]|uniref:Cytochrome b mRNA-processing protein 4 n=1 Tax=Tilletiopsis washingtonensis TaxID=58919 RepID=A0A316ZB68_9BASI|nr:hypothetical protein FA09DRAFT_339441 [Tilletiopsis washingtonensis]PWN97443.1 hypothetical protein FA09DRAFT_339441 [Tilletiopsis washingtonensis]
MSAPPSLGRALISGGAVIALGYGIMKVTTPSDEQFYNKLSPELKKKVDAQRDATRRKAAYAEQIARARTQDDSQAVWSEGLRAKDSAPPPAMNTPAGSR